MVGFWFQDLASKLTSHGRGKHHLGDFLPPDELEKFMEKCQAIKEGRTPDLSDYKVRRGQRDGEEVEGPPKSP